MKDANKTQKNNPSLHFSANDFGYIDRLFMTLHFIYFSGLIKKKNGYRFSDYHWLNGEPMIYTAW
jgi:hypothetical protein